MGSSLIIIVLAIILVVAVRVVKNLESEDKVNGKEKNYSIKSDNSNNTIAGVLNVIGWIVIVIGFIGGIAIGENTKAYNGSEFNYVAMLITWLSCGLTALLFFAIGEIIQILHDIRLKVYKK